MLRLRRPPRRPRGPVAGYPRRPAPVASTRPSTDRRRRGAPLRDDRSGTGGGDLPSNGCDERPTGDHPCRPRHDLAPLPPPCPRPARRSRSPNSMVAGCRPCADLHADLLALRVATLAMPTPSRPRDYTLTADDVARLRPKGWRRLVAALGPPEGRRRLVAAFRTAEMCSAPRPSPLAMRRWALSASLSPACPRSMAARRHRAAGRSRPWGRVSGVQGSGHLSATNRSRRRRCGLRGVTPGRQAKGRDTQDRSRGRSAGTPPPNGTAGGRPTGGAARSARAARNGTPRTDPPVGFGGNTLAAGRRLLDEPARSDPPKSRGAPHRRPAT